MHFVRSLFNNLFRILKLIDINENGLMFAVVLSPIKYSKVSFCFCALEQLSFLRATALATFSFMKTVYGDYLFQSQFWKIIFSQRLYISFRYLDFFVLSCINQFLMISKTFCDNSSLLFHILSIYAMSPFSLINQVRGFSSSRVSKHFCAEQIVNILGFAIQGLYVGTYITRVNIF